MVMINRSFYQEIVQLAAYQAFQSCVLLSDRQEEQAYREELVLRFFCQADFSGTSTELPKEYGEYLTDWMRVVAEPGSGKRLDDGLFKATFDLLSAELGEDSFRRLEGGRHLGPFSISSYEFVTSGVAANLQRWKSASPGDLRARVESIWTAAEFRENSGTGVSPRRRVPRLILGSRQFFH